MRAVRLLEHALTKNPEWVLDAGVGKGMHAFSFLAHGVRVTGMDVREAPLEHPLYNHLHDPYEEAEIEENQYDMIFCSHVLEHVQNPGHFLMHLRKWLKPGGWLAIAVPTSRQERLHVGHLTVWTPAHLVYNLVCAGWDCRKAIWYTEYLTIGLMVQKEDDIDFSGRTALPNEVFWLNQYSPVHVQHEGGAWWGNRWPEDIQANRVADPPFVTVGYEKKNLPPRVQLAYGPNPALRRPPGGQHE